MLLLPYLVRQTDEHKSGITCWHWEGSAEAAFVCHSGMNQIKIWEAKLDYLVVRQTDESKSREWMPGAGRVGTNPGLHADVG